MNGLRLPQELFGNTVQDNNIFKVKKKVYNEIMQSVKDYIDKLYSVCTPEKQNKIDNLEPTIVPYKNSLFEFYKGVHLPILDKTAMILDGIYYIPIMQLVDNPIHSQKFGKFILVKNNLRYCMVKMKGDTSIVLNKNSFCPLFIYQLLKYDMDYFKTLEILGYELTDNDIDAKYYIPYVDEQDNNEIKIIKVKACEEGYWKDYLLNPFILENLALHKMAIEKYKKILDENDTLTIDKDDDDGDKITNETDDTIEEDIEDITSNIVNSKDDEVTKLEKIDEHYVTNQEKMIKLTYLVSCYLQLTKKGKKNIKKWHILNTIRKFNSKDMTMGNWSILSLVEDVVMKDSLLPQATTINDLAQKMIRYFEWYALKLISIRSFPDTNMIMDLCKIEQKLVYDNCTNIIAELSLLHRCILVGKGSVPKEAASANLRNNSPSYYGIFDPIRTPSGQNTGLIRHVVPEVRTFDLQEAMQEEKNINIFDQEVIETC